MSQYKSILFLGLGGAGQRHLRYLSAAFPDAKLSCFRSRRTTPMLNPDFSVNAGASLEEEYKLHVFSDYEAALSDGQELVVISTPTSLHAGQICKALDAGCDVLCEKPGIVGLEDFNQIKSSLHNSKGNLHIGFQRLHHPVSIAFRDFICEAPEGEILAIDCQICSHFPSWHKYEDYRTLYAGRKSLGGGVVRTECHELALLVSIIGRFEGLKLEQRRDTKFEIDVESRAVLQGTLNGIPTTLDMDFLASDSRRAITVKTKDEYRRFDFDGNQVLTSCDGKDFTTLHKLKDVDQFQAQLNAVFKTPGFDNSKTLKLLENMALVFEESSAGCVVDAV